MANRFDLEFVGFAEARFYDANHRQWMSVDPIKSGLNWYLYVEGNPATFFDPTGLVAVIGESEDGRLILDTPEGNQEITVIETKKWLSDAITKMEIAIESAEDEYLTARLKEQKSSLLNTLQTLNEIKQLGQQADFANLLRQDRISNLRQNYFPVIFCETEKFQQYAKQVNYDPWAMENYYAQMMGQSVPNWDFDSITSDESLVARILFHEDKTPEGQYAIAWTIKNRFNKSKKTIREIIMEGYANPQWMDMEEAYFAPLDWIAENPITYQWHPQLKLSGLTNYQSWVMATHIARDLISGTLGENPFVEKFENPSDVQEYVGIGYQKEGYVRIGNSFFYIRTA